MLCLIELPKSNSFSELKTRESFQDCEFAKKNIFLDLKNKNPQKWDLDIPGSMTLTTGISSAVLIL